MQASISLFSPTVPTKIAVLIFVTQVLHFQHSSHLRSNRHLGMSGFFMLPRVLASRRALSIAASTCF